jgi:uncharacterized repeat protein (TIGR01451 family)
MSPADRNITRPFTKPLVKYSSSSGPQSSRRLPAGLKRPAALVMLFALLAAGLYSAASASSARLSAGRRAAATEAAPAAAPNRARRRAAAAPASHIAGLLPTLLLQAGGGETIATYESDCTTPSSTFELGDTVCAKITGAQLGAGGFAARRVNWVARTGSVVQAQDVTTAAQSFSFTLPSSETSLVTDAGGGTVTVDNRGLWKVYIADAAEASFRTGVTFTVKAPTPYSDLQVSQSATVQGSGVSAGSSGVFEIFVTNAGPNDAVNVVLSDTIPANTSYVSLSETTNLGFACSPTAGTGGIPGCTLASMPAGSAAKIVFAYSVDAGTAAGTLLTNSVHVGSDTTELEPGDNDASFESAVPVGAGAQSCTLICHEDMVVTANTTQGGQPGAFVTFGAAAGGGECGTISSSPASGAFFPVGPTTVNVTSQTGGGSCSFIVNVVTTAAPTISCPADKTAADDGSGSATVDPGTPTTNPSTGVSVVGVRNDGAALSAPYPVGTTAITWTVTDSYGRTATCTQRIIVTGGACPGDTTPPTITAPANIIIGTGADSTGCSVALGDDELGDATAADDCASGVTVTRTGVPAGSVFPIGMTTITYTATDTSNHQATATQTVTVFDDTKPVIVAPPDAAYTCLSQVPAADPSQATRGVVLDEDGNPLPPGPPFDNCGVPAVTFTESSTGAGSAASPRVITRTFKATDAAGNFSTSVQTITVTDPTAPTLNVPADIVVGNDTGSCSAVVNFTVTATDNCNADGVTVQTSPASGSVFSKGTTTVTATATDWAGNVTTKTFTVTVNDTEKPTLNAPNIVVPNDPGSCSAVVNFTSLTAADNCGSVNVQTSSASGSVFPKGTTTVTATATDTSGNTTTKTFTVTVNDTEKPTISYPAGGVTVYLPLNSPATSTQVNYTVTAADNCGVQSLNVSPASGSVFNVGPTLVTATAVDTSGNTTVRTFTVTVLYNFTGFFSPVSNLPTLNLVNAGRAIPVKFSLSGNKGLGIFPAGSPASQQISCSSSAPIANLEDTVTAGSSSLSYDSGSDQYNYVWKTEGSWAGTCRSLVVTLNDGSAHTALFKFK